MIAIVDIETGGFSRKLHGLCEIGLIIMKPNGEVLLEQDWLIKPYEGVVYEPKAFEVNKLSLELLREEGFDAKEVAEEFTSLIVEKQVSKMVGHNIVAFDAPFLETFLHSHLKERASFSKENMYDTLREAKKKFPGFPKHDLQSLCFRFGISTFNQHRALGDCRATRELYLKLTT